MTQPVETAGQVGGRIREARVAEGLTQGLLADLLGLDRSALVRIEAGDRRVTALELLRLAEVLRVPLAHFVYRSPAAITSRRRTLDDDPGVAERLRFRLDTLLESHVRDTEDLRRWGYLTPLPDVPMRSGAGHDDARDLARRARRYVGCERGPLPALASVAEDVGLYVLVVNLDVEGASLTPDPGFGVAVLGGEAAPGRRRFTAAHEIGHHLLGDEYQSDAGVAASRDEREPLIDVFAMEFLLPVDDVQSQWSSLAGDDWERLLRLAASYRVSWAMAVRVAAEAGVLPVDDVAGLLARTPQLGDFLRVLGAGPAEDLAINETGPRWRQAVIRAYTDARITDSRAVEMLHGALTESDLPALPEPAP